MIFNSIEFLLFFHLFFVLYWFVFNKNLKYQNFLILISSYFFYGWWDYRFLLLIFLSTIVDYFIGLKIPVQSSKKNQKILLWCSVLFNLGVLGFFKYYNFFIGSWITLFSSIGYDINSVWTLNIILPVGISFYTFQTMSYTIDIFRKQLEPTKDFISFASFVSFFPQLVAGPIERATNLIPQILNKREFKYEQGFQGLGLIVWGLFKKVIVADSLAPIVNDVFINYESYGGEVLLLGAIYFSFQIYCDFSGYSDIAIGLSSLLGISLMTNFDFPYFSRNIGEFWRKWHISLSSWFKDYLYIPLGGSKGNRYSSLRNIFIVFLVSGFWHGANWTFIVWGLYHSLLFIPSFFLKTNRKYNNSIIAKNSIFPSFKEIIQIIFTFILVTFGWIFFRSETLADSFKFINNIFSFDTINIYNASNNQIKITFYILYILIFLGFDFLIMKSKKISYILIIILILLILFFLQPNSENNFIYFNF